MNRQQALRLAINALEFKRAHISDMLLKKSNPPPSMERAARETIEDCTKALVIIRQELAALTRYPNEAKL